MITGFLLGSMLLCLAVSFILLGAQTQTPSYRKSEGKMVDYTPSAAVYAGDVILLGSMVCVAPLDITARQAVFRLVFDGDHNGQSANDEERVLGPIEIGAGDVVLEFLAD